jgi:hypothetical protein
VAHERCGVHHAYAVVIAFGVVALFALVLAVTA